MTQCLSFFNLRQQATRVQAEAGLGAELRHDVVVVGIEPLGHLAGMHTVAAAVIGGAATGDTKILIQLGALQPLYSGRQVAEGKAQIQHLIIEGKIPHRDQIESRLTLPVLRPQFGGSL